MRLAPSMVLSFAAAAVAQGNHVWFVPTAAVEGWCHAGSPCCVQDIGPRDVAVVTKATCQDCAMKVAPHLAWNTLVGDDDGDALHWQASLFGEIDAVLMKRAGAGAPDMRHLFLSPKRALGTAVSGTPRLRPGDVAAIVRRGGADGQLEFFLRAEQVRDALGLTVAPADIDVDAIASDDAGNIFLSLDTDVIANLRVGAAILPRTLHDGAVAVIPATAITWDARANVAGVVANSAMILLNEGQVNTAVVHAAVNDHLGAPVTAIGDLDALEVDETVPPALSLTWGGVVYTFPHLAFAGETLTGLGVLSTAGGGAIFTFGTVPCCLQLARGSGCLTGPTTGFEMGVQAPGGGAATASLNALAIRFTPSPYPFFVETCTPVVIAPAAVQIGSKGGNLPRILILSAGPTAAGTAALSAPSPWTPAVAHPDIYLNGFIGTVFMPADSLTLSIPAIAPMNLVFQAACIDVLTGMPALSTPGTLVIR
ncbi:MAG: hypothetical protein IPK26_13745 [Planctomycetes bacterium]|nr:hypothetical protein [Planctomycetota bacterium]